MEALRSGAAAPSREQLGRRVDLPEAMRSKMESAFGADLGAVKLYESEAVAEAGANAVTQGSNIAFAPGMLDFTSFGGQSLLGHEISHVVSQARGEVTGGGFLNDRALEARADREGTLAASGETVNIPTAPLSGVSADAAAGPMQADKAENKAKKHQDEQVKQYLTMLDLGRQSSAHNREMEKAGVDIRARDPVAEKLAKQKNKAAKKARKALKWENYWNSKLDARAEKTGEDSAADRGAVARKLMDALQRKYTDDSGLLDYESYRDDAKKGEVYMHDSDSSLMEWLDSDSLEETYRDAGLGDFLSSAVAISNMNERLDNLSPQQQAELDRLNRTPGAMDEAEAKHKARYAPIKTRLRRDNPWLSYD